MARNFVAAPRLWRAISHCESPAIVRLRSSIAATARKPHFKGVYRSGAGFAVAAGLWHL